jgi:hypothetical protein
MRGVTMIRLIPALATIGTLVAGLALTEEITVDEQACCVVLEADAPVAICSINGDIAIEEWESNQVCVEYVITCGNPDELEVLEIRCDTSDGIFCEVVYPDDWEGDLDATVDFLVRLPGTTDVDLSTSTVNGDILLSGCCGSSVIEIVNGAAEADGFSGRLCVNVVNGEISLTDVPGLVSANIVNGEITGTLVELDSDAEIAAVSGRVVLCVPTDAHVSVSTLSGTIDIPVGTVDHEIVGSTAEFGEGEYEIEIDTVSGDIELTH